MIDKAAYDNLAQRLETELNDPDSTYLKWYVDRYDARLGEAHISGQAALAAGTTPAAHLELTYKQMKIWYGINIECENFRAYYYVGRALIEDGGLNYIGIIKNLVAEQIALALIEKGIV